MAERKVCVWNRLSKHLIQLCQDTDGVLTGLLFGHKCDGIIHVVAASKCLSSSFRDIERDADVIVKFLPPGVGMCGIFIRTSQASVRVIQEQTLQRVVDKETQAAFRDSPILVFAVEATNKGSPALYWYSDKLEVAAEVEYVEENIMDSYMTVRLQANLPFGIKYTEEEGDLCMRIREQIESLEEIVCSEVGVFHVKDSSILLQNGCEAGDVSCVGIQKDTAMQEVLKHRRTEEEFPRKKGRICDEVVDVELLTQTTGDRAVQRSLSCAPIIHHDHEEFSHISMRLGLDVLIPVNPEMPVSMLPELMVEGTSRQLLQMQSCVAKFSKGPKFCHPTVRHFKPAQTGCLMCVVWPEKAEDTVQDNFREALHERFLLSKDRPAFRASMVHILPNETSVGGYLLNTHVGLPPSGVSGGQQYLVQGTYTYHHYMQDRMDDNGWGCAYRSLQTLVSWLRHQGYTDKPVPTHKEIQQALVDVGDKEPSFIGSRKWIGSTEVSYVLDQLFGVSSKIMFVSNGAELGSKGRELAMHFEKQGTPLMIGGGVLAHTILGVDFNDVTGALKFLILDPHYTGAEDLKVIQDKGWCGWKGPDFWNQQAYYNLCMPQRPLSI